MLKEEIIEKISKYFKLTSFEAEKIYNDIFSIIVSGVKHDNIVDVTNFGEFIIKYNNGNGDPEKTPYKKTVEFLATSKLEDDINQSTFDTGNIISPVSQKADEISNIKETPVKEVIKEQVSDKAADINPVKPIIVAEPHIKEQPQIFQKPVTVEKPVQELNTPAFSSTSGNVSSNPVEEEMRRKREEILHKISKPMTFDEIKKAEKEYVKPVIEPVKEEKIEAVVIPENITPIVKPIEVPKIIPEPVAEKKTEEIEDFSKKTFADFFTEVKDEHATVPAGMEEKTQKIEEPVHNVIPPSVVELHNEITNASQHETMAFPTLETAKSKVLTTNGNGNGVSTGEYRANDNSYYIWYKDVEANTTDTQNLSYEYELLYQATKEAEYKSKLKIYVTTFIIFFSIILVLLIFSPVIYKIFFKPVEAPQTEKVEENPQVNSEQSNQNNNNVQPEQQQANTNVTPPPVTNNETPNNNQQPPVNTTENKTEQPKQEQQQTSSQPPQQQEQKQQQQPQQPQQQQTTEPKIEGVTKNSMGWMDDKYKVIYIKLDNGKFTIQESAWDSDTKAGKRISTVSAYNIGGLKGSVLKVDLGEKGTWFRARFGEFTSLEEARQKAEELRNKERMKLQAAVLLFLLYA